MIIKNCNRTLACGGPARVEILRHITVRILQQQSGEFCGSRWQGLGQSPKVVKKVYKTAKAGNKINVKGILKSEWIDIADNTHTIFDSDASLFEKGIAAFDLATGFGDEAK